MCMMYLIGWRSNGLSEWVSDTSDKSVSEFFCLKLWEKEGEYLVIRNN